MPTAYGGKLRSPQSREDAWRSPIQARKYISRSVACRRRSYPEPAPKGIAPVEFTNRLESALGKVV